MTVCANTSDQKVARFFARARSHGAQGVSDEEISALVDLAEASINFVQKGFRNNGERLYVIENKDNSDPHYRWCNAIEALEKLE